LPACADAACALDRNGESVVKTPGAGSVVAPPAPRQATRRRRNAHAHRVSSSKAKGRLRSNTGARRCRSRPGRVARLARGSLGRTWASSANALQSAAYCWPWLLFFLQQTPQQREKFGLLLEALSSGKAATPDRLLCPAQPGDPPAHRPAASPRRGSASARLPSCCCSERMVDPEPGLALRVLRSQERIIPPQLTELGRSTLAAFIQAKHFRPPARLERGAANTHRSGPASSSCSDLVRAKSRLERVQKANRARFSASWDKSSCRCSASRACVLASGAIPQSTPAGPSESQS